MLTDPKLCQQHTVMHFAAVSAIFSLIFLATNCAKIKDPISSDAGGDYDDTSNSSNDNNDTLEPTTENHTDTSTENTDENTDENTNNNPTDDDDSDTEDESNDETEVDDTSGTDIVVPTSSEPEQDCTYETAVEKCGDISLCVDGYCCDTTCDGDCVACNIEGSEGVCTPIPFNADPENECGTCSICNGDTEAPACVPVPKGQDVKNDCDMCRYCNGDPHKSACSPVPDGEDPFNDCAMSEPSSCGQNGYCDGTGTCALFDEKTTCDEPECSNLEDVSRLFEYRCNGIGDCTVQSRTCGGYLCHESSKSCASECTPTPIEQTCSAGFICDAYECVVEIPKINGEECLYDSECQSSHCVDSVCCNGPCAVNCMACNLMGSEGTCSQVPANSDPKNDCPTCFACDVEGNCSPVPVGEDYAGDCTEDASSIGCGLSGFCNGTGGCAFFGDDRVCGALTCQDVSEGASQLIEERCDGIGNCERIESTCGSLKCADAVSCLETCGTGEQCINELPCVDGTCPMNKTDGSPCLNGAECVSQFCVDGVCCNGVCNGLCQRCDVKGSEGMCTVAPDNTDADNDCPTCQICKEGLCAPVAAGEDPADDCSTSGLDECGYTGVCDNNSACAVKGPAYTCGSVCDGALSASLSCDGLGIGTSACNIIGSAEPCDNYLACNPFDATCPADCITEADCINGYFCDLDNICKPASGLGEPCEDSMQCSDNRFCVDGVCCSSACEGTCQACNVANNLGTCTAVSPGSDPDDECPVCSACDGAFSCVALNGSDAPSGDCVSTVDDDPICGYTGKCIAGACEMTAVGTECGDMVCAGLDDSPNVTRYECDGLGICQELTDQTCGGYRCTEDKEACLSSCEDRDDCASSFSCNDGLCTNNNPLCTPCLLGTECASGICADGICCETSCTGVCESCAVDGACGYCTPEPNGSWDGIDYVGDHEEQVEPKPDCEICEVCDGEGACRPVDTVTYPDDSPDPRNQCGDPRGEETCNFTGVCTDGIGECAFYPSGQTCGQSCPADGNLLFDMTCDGAGSCIPEEEGELCPNSMTCTDDGERCRLFCGDNQDCVATAWCDNGECVDKKPDGDPCGAWYECINSNCPSPEGVCCNQPCDGECESCNQTSFVGTCRNVPEGENPNNECNDSIWCNGADFCNGQGTCTHAGNPCDELDDNICNDCNENTDRCIQSQGTSCGDDANTFCTSADTCDSTGVCLPNHSPDETACAPDTDDCTYDYCIAGECEHVNSGDSDGDLSCDLVDNCPNDPNGGQADADGDGVGDICDDCPADPTKSDTAVDGPCVKVEMYVEVYNNFPIVVFYVLNYGKTPVQMSDIAMRYWYTVDGAFSYQESACYAYGLGATSEVITGSNMFVPVSRQNANYYVEIAFTGGGQIPAVNPDTPDVPTSSGQIKYAWHTDNYIDIGATPGNDYSYQSGTTPVETERVTLYFSGSNEPIWGIEPSPI